MKSIYLVNMQEHLDNGFLLLKEDASFSSPISVLYFEYYENLENLNSTLSSNLNEIQVIVTDLELPIETVKLGQSQCPKLEEYADNVDVIEFLKSV